MNNILIKAEEIKDWIIEVRRDLHSTPELGLEEFITKEKIKKYLDEIGIDYVEFKDHTAVMAFINTVDATKTAAIRADIDALPIDEVSKTSYKSVFKGKMHACGHDAHTAMLLGACKVLYSIKDTLQSNVKFFFQPAEETVGGAELMIKDGCMENPKIDYMFGLHVMPHIDTGYVELKYDTLNASTDTINITIQGKDGHGAYPHQGIDAIVIAAHVITAIQSIVSRNIDPTDSAVISLGVINGGVKGNVICDKVNITGTLRTLDPTTRHFTKERIRKIVESTCESFLGHGIVEFEEGYAPLVNSNDVVNLVKRNVEDMLGHDKVVMKSKPSLGAEDFSFFIENTKGAFYHLGCRNEEKKITSLLHTSNFDIDEDCLPIGVALHVKNVLSI